MADRFSYSSTRKITSNNLSFSSTLLDEICRSIDGDGDEIRESMRQKRDDRFLFNTEEQVANYQRACMIEKWMEKKLVARLEIQEINMSGKDRQYSSSSSSDSSCGGDGGSRGGGFFSSSEAESYPVRHPKPVRTGKLGFEKEAAKSFDDSGINLRNRRGISDGLEQKPKNESRFVKTKSKALKIYGDLKKVKQPISPGGKVAAFLNSLFAAGNLKKPKSGDDSPSLKSTTTRSTTTTTCSSASSFSRSCLNKTTPPSSAKSAGSAQRSVRFFPVSVIVDEDCQPCGHKSLHQKISNSNDVVDLIETGIDEELLMHVMEKNRRVGEADGDLAMQRRKKDQIGCEFEHSFDIFSKIRDQNRGFDQEFDDEDDEFDGASCASSDLFELENLSAIGMEELPVYETTHLEKIQTVAMD